MTIERGAAWGAPWSPRGQGEVPEADGDADLARLLAGTVGDTAPGRGRPVGATTPAPEVALHRGDLLRTLGLDGARPPAERHRFPIDVGVARLQRSGGGVEVGIFVAHLTVRNRPLTGLGPGLSLAVLNAPWLGPLRLGPRAHPNDGHLDVIEGTVGPLQRREANRRAVSGSHLPHPRLRVSRVTSFEHRWPRPVPVWLDGVRRGRFIAVAVEVVADAAAVVA